MVQVRYIVIDMESAIEFYTQKLGFHLEMHPVPAFAMLSRGDLRLVLSVPNPAGGGGQPMPGGSPQEPGGGNPFVIEVSNLGSTVEMLENARVHFRNTIMTGMGARQIILEDPSGNPIELFELIMEEARLPSKPYLC